MKARNQLGVALMLAVLATACEHDGARVTDPSATGAAGPQSRGTPATATVSVFATGLNLPRGLEFGPDHQLYVAEAGTGGGRGTEGQCEQVPPPAGPYTGGNTARISRIGADGQRTTVAENLPSAQTSVNLGYEKEGVADVVWRGNTLYAVLAGGGCSHGNPDQPNAVLRINPDGSWTQVADLSTFYQNNPVQDPEENDFEPDGMPYSMLGIGTNLYVLEANHGELDRVNPMTGTIERVIDISATQGHVVPTASAWFRGNFYVANLSTAPFTDGSAKVFRIDPQGQTISVAEDDLTTVLGLAFDIRGRMYVLEASTGNTPEPPFYVPNSGKVIRIDGSNREEIATGINYPTAMTIGPDGNLYVSASGFLSAPGDGQILKIELRQEAGAIINPNTGGSSNHSSDLSQAG